MNLNFIEMCKDYTMEVILGALAIMLFALLISFIVDWRAEYVKIKEEKKSIQKRMNKEIFNQEKM